MRAVCVCVCAAWVRCVCAVWVRAVWVRAACVRAVCVGAVCVGAYGVCVCVAWRTASAMRRGDGDGEGVAAGPAAACCRLTLGVMVLAAAEKAQVVVEPSVDGQVGGAPGSDVTLAHHVCGGGRVQPKLHERVAIKHHAMR